MTQMQNLLGTCARQLRGTIVTKEKIHPTKSVWFPLRPPDVWLPWENYPWENYVVIFALRMSVCAIGRWCYLVRTSLIGWLLIWILWHINLCRLYNATSIFIQMICFISNNSVYHEYTFQLSKTFLFQAIQFRQTVLIQTIQFSGSTVLMTKTVPFQTIQFNKSEQFRCQNSSVSSNSV